MTVLALLVCSDPLLLQARTAWLAQQLARHPDAILNVETFDGGCLLSVGINGSDLVDHLAIRDDRIGRFGWCKQFLAAANLPASQYFASLQTDMPAMSALWWWAAQSQKLVIATDPLGARPLFYSQDRESILVASALWVFEACPWIKLGIDEASLHQRVTLGYCLDGATPYRAVRRVQGGSEVALLQGKPQAASVRRWHRWDAIATDTRPLDQQLDDIQASFSQAISAQDDGAVPPISALSGGLDTRVVIAGLCAAKRPPTCLTFTWRNSLDGAIAQQFAAFAGLRQHVFDVPRPLDEPFLIKSSKALAGPAFQATMRQPIRLWTGYGGSVGAGYVHSGASIVALARAGDTQRAARALLMGKDVGIASFLFGAARARALTAQLHTQVMAALDAQNPDDPGRRLQLYLLENQEPEQLRPAYENADRLGFDIAAPFYDPALLTKWLAVPLDEALYHQAYVQWMQRLPFVTSVPWQAYPGHVQSSLPLPVHADQWSDTDSLYQRQQRCNDIAFARKCAAAGVGATSMATPSLVGLWRGLAVQAAVGLGLHRYSYLRRTMATYAAFEHGKGATLVDGL
jgi:asparagine synthase (glutamine-hydrolysing)